ncbi:MAG: flagellar hook-associated protein FlgL [Micrococcus sp.]|nr:flagellar hook-associated protein FlgL [Micrococcus sp.]
MINRVTSAMTTAVTRANLQDSARTLAQLQERAASREAISRPSDDPAGTRTALAARAELTRTTQYERNLQNADTWLNGVDSALQSGLDIMNRVQELALRGASGTLNEAGRAANATEIEQLRSELLSLANTQVLGRSIFAGTSTRGAAYEGTPPTWTGPLADDGKTAAATVQRRISDTETIQVDLPGPAAFGNGTSSVFAVLDKLAQDLRSDADITPSIATIEAARKNMASALTESGARHATVGRAMEATQLRLTELEATRGSTEETDLAEAALELKMQQINYEAALAVTAQALQTSLLDYLR